MVGRRVGRWMKVSFGDGNPKESGDSIDKRGASSTRKSAVHQSISGTRLVHSVLYFILLRNFRLAYVSSPGPEDDHHHPSMRPVYWRTSPSSNPLLVRHQGDRAEHGSSSSSSNVAIPPIVFGSRGSVFNFENLIHSVK